MFGIDYQVVAVTVEISQRGLEGVPGRFIETTCRGIFIQPEVSTTIRRPPIWRTFSSTAESEGFAYAFSVLRLIHCDPIQVKSAHVVKARGP